MGATESAVRPDFDSMNLYEVLDVNENATKEEIKVVHFDLQVVWRA
jgi:curved DNA-binding protein CbpA